MFGAEIRRHRRGSCTAVTSQPFLPVPAGPACRDRLEPAMSKQLRVNPIACSGHGLCAELLPELIMLDEWGYPVLDGQPVPPGLHRAARRAVASCPALALLLSPAP